MALSDGERLDYWMPACFGVLGVVPLLRFTAAHVSAGGADPQVEGGPATLTPLGARLCRGAVEMRTGRGADAHGNLAFCRESLLDMHMGN